jgi:hypothetical protein
MIVCAYFFAKLHTTIHGTMSTKIIPRDVSPRVDTTNVRWCLPMADNGSVEFDVLKSSGLVVALSDQPGFPRDGVAVVLDARGSQTTDMEDSLTSMSYVARASSLATPVNREAIIRNLELSDYAPRHVKIAYQWGHIWVWVDGVQVLATSNPHAMKGVRFVSFGHMGLRSGVGSISNLRIA